MNLMALQELGFPALLAWLKGFCASPLGSKAVEAMTFFDDPEEVKAELLLVSQAKEAVLLHGSFPLGDARDIYSPVEAAALKGYLLSGQQLWDCYRTLDALEQTIGYFARIRKEFPELGELAQGLVPLVSLKEKMAKAIGPEGEVLDSASAILARTRARIKQLRARIVKDLEEVLSQERYKSLVAERLVTLRGGRYVIPVKAGFKKLLPAVIHDQSASGATFYVEPLSVLDGNNQLARLAGLEKEEEKRILTSLTREVERNYKALLANLALLSRLDLLEAKGRLSLALKADPVEIVEKVEFALLGARHPFLVYRDEGLGQAQPQATTPRAAVPVDLVFEKDKNTLLVSGVNAGGKTVALKTLGLLALMLKAGLHLPAAQGSCLPLFKEIFIDLGDKQDVAGDLSSFSAHLLNLKEILAQADDRSLVLLDELGSSTDPVEGAALAAALLDELMEKGATVMVTTHLPNLVKWGLAKRGCQCAAVGFNLEKAEPTYQLLYGLAGSSYALAISRRLGLPEEVVEKARLLKSRQEVDFQKLVEEMAQARAALEEEQKELAQLKAELASLRDLRRQSLAAARKASEEIAARFRSRLETILYEAEEALRQPPETRSLAKLEKVKADILKAVPSLRRLRPLENLKPGDRVRLEKLGKEGEVVQVQPEKRQALIQTGQVKVASSFSGLRRAKGDKPVSRTWVHAQFEPITSGRLKLIGLTVAEALPRLDKFIDTALLSGLSNLEIVHGIGTGRLAAAVKEFLTGHPQVKGFKPVAPEKGGAAVTLVELTE